MSAEAHPIGTGRRNFLPSGGMDLLIREHDWSGTPLRDRMNWPQSLRTLVGVMLAARQPMFLVWGAERVILYNDGFVPVLGPRHPQALGKPFVQVWPELAERAGPAMEEACSRTGAHGDDTTFVAQGSGASGDARFRFSCSPVRDESGGVAGALCIGTELNALEVSERHLKFRLELDERLRHMCDPREVMAVAAEMLGRYLNASRANYGYVEHMPSGETFIVERDWTDGRTPSLVGRYRVADFGLPLINVLKSGQTVCLHDAFEDRLTADEGIAATYVAIGARSGITVPLIKGDRIAAALLVHQVEPRQWREDERALVEQVAERTWDAVERARAQAALRENEERLRDILESINDAFYAVDGEWRFSYVNRRTEELWGRSRESLMGKVCWDEFPHVVGTESYKAHMAVMESRRLARLEILSPLTHQWLDMSIYPTADGGLSVYFRDISDRKRAEDHREMLINELNHRVKNMLATVQSIATQTLRNGGAPGPLRATLEARLFALARAHDVLTRDNWEGAALREIVGQAIEPYRGVGEDRLPSTGPDVRVPPRTALALAMALQELATNAVKHGALANASGIVDISWSLDQAAEAPRLHLRWEERGGPAVQPPQRRGFGTRLIERSLAYDLQGEAKIEFAPAGVVCTINAPLHDADPPLNINRSRRPAFGAWRELQS